MEKSTAFGTNSQSLLTAPHAKWTITFAAVLLFVGGVSLYDGYLVVRTGDEISSYEKNPVGKYLIEFNHGDPSLFLQFKAIGTVVVLSFLAALQRSSRRIARPVALALVVFQSGLLVFLEGN